MLVMSVSIHSLGVHFLLEVEIIMRDLSIVEIQAVGGMGNEDSYSFGTIAGGVFGATAMVPFAIWRGAVTGVMFGSGIGTGLLTFGGVLGAYVVGGALVGATIGSVLTGH
jgi:hypothetical protein